MYQDVGAVVLAAGRGSRMKATPSKNKVTYTINDRPMIAYTIDTLKQCPIDHITVVVGFAKESVIQTLKDQVNYAVQDNPMGTGHAVKVALPHLPPDLKHVLVMYGDDSAFYPSSLIQTLVETHLQHQNHLTLITIDHPHPTGLGRIIRDRSGQWQGIVEEKNATEIQKQITEINTGLYCFEINFLRQAIEQLQVNPVSGEYYLTDVVAYAKTSHYQLEAVLWPDSSIWHGVNTQEELKQAETRMNQKNAVQ